MAEPDVVALALLPALLWGFEPIVSKWGLDAGGRSMQAALTAILTAVACYWAALVALHGPAGAVAGLDHRAVGIFVAGGFVGTAIGRLGMFESFHRVGASISTATMNMRPLFATAIALVWLGEPVGPLTGFGVVAIVAGLVVLSVSRGGDLGGWEPRQLLLPLATALAFALGNVIRRFGLTTTDVTVLQAVAINETTAMIGLGGYVLARNRRVMTDPPRSTYRFFVVSGVITAVSLLSLFAAFDRGPVAVVDPITAVSPLFTTVFAYYLLREIERVTVGVVAGAVLTVVGVVLIVGGEQLLALV